MRTNTIESYFDYQCKAILKEFCEWKDIERDSLTDEMLWNDKEILGELLFTKMMDVEGFEALNVIEEE